MATTQHHNIHTEHYLQHAGKGAAGQPPACVHRVEIPEYYEYVRKKLPEVAVVDLHHARRGAHHLQGRAHTHKDTQ